MDEQGLNQATECGYKTYRQDRTEQLKSLVWGQAEQITTHFQSWESWGSMKTGFLIFVQLE